MILVLGAIFDSVDGRVARMTGTQSQFGEQFDSMSDLISFGLAPALMMYQKYLHEFGRLGAAVAFAFVLSGALRLARFNANIEKVSSTFFQGLPSPGAALAIVGYILLGIELPILEDLPLLAAAYTLFYGLLMISTIPFNSFKDSSWTKKHKKGALFIFFIFSLLVFIYYKLMFSISLAIYTLASLIYYSSKRREFGDVFHWQEEQDED